VIDSHVHLNRREFADDLVDVLARAGQTGVSGFLNVGYDLISSAESIALAEADPRILATVGIHPHDATLLADAEGNLTEDGRQALAELEAMAHHGRVRAIGEIGLDYYRDLSPRSAQRTALTVQLELAEQVGLPVVFHIRDAWPETLAVIDEVGVPSRGGVLHSFTGNEQAVIWARERGLMLGIGGPVTYKNSKLPELVALAGADAFLLETDAPWLPPVPHRGKRNESGYLHYTLAAAASAVSLTPEELDQRTTASFEALFGARSAESNTTEPRSDS